MADNKKVLILDSSQLQTFSDCVRMWDYNYRQSLVTIQQAESAKSNAIAMGTYGHKMLEIYYQGIGQGYISAAMLDRALDFNPDNEECECNHSRESHSDGICKAENCTCELFKPVPFPLNQDERSVVRQRIRDYVWTYITRDIKPVNKESVEVGFSEKIYEDDKYLFILEGRIDILGFLGDTPIWADHKFQLRARDLYHKSIQFRNYALVTKKLLGVINYIRLVKNVTKDTYKRELTTFTVNELEWWKRELIILFFKVQTALDHFELTGTFEPTWGACSGKFGYPCNYTQLCNEENLNIRNALIKQLYTKRKEWKPW